MTSYSSTTSNFDVYLRQQSTQSTTRSDTDSGYTRSASVQSYQSYQSRISDTDASGRVAFCAVKNCQRYAELYCDADCRVKSISVRPFQWKGCGRATCHKHSVIRHDHGDITMCRRCEGHFEQILQEQAIVPSCACFGFFRKKNKKDPERENLLQRKRSVEYTPGSTPPRSRSIFETPPKPTNVWKRVSLVPFFFWGTLHSFFYHCWHCFASESVSFHYSWAGLGTICI